MFNYAPMLGSSIPFSLPGASIASTAKSTLSFSSIFSGIQKTATTINQIVPLYHNVKPIISNSKALLGVMKGIASAPKQQPKSEVKKETEPNKDIIDIKEGVKEEKVEVKSTNTPSKPFFA